MHQLSGKLAHRYGLFNWVVYYDIVYAAVYNGLNGFLGKIAIFSGPNNVNVRFSYFFKL